MVTQGHPVFIKMAQSLVGLAKVLCMPKGASQMHSNPSIDQLIEAEAIRSVEIQVSKATSSIRKMAQVGHSLKVDEFPGKTVLDLLQVIEKTIVKHKTPGEIKRLISSLTHLGKTSQGSPSSMSPRQGGSSKDNP